MIRSLFYAAGVFTLFSAAAVYSQIPKLETPDALMLRFPDVSADKIVFGYEADLWIVDKAGGIARRLSSPPGAELFP